MHIVFSIYSVCARRVGVELGAECEHQSHDHVWVVLNRLGARIGRTFMVKHCSTRASRLLSICVPHGHNKIEVKGMSIS